MANTAVSSPFKFNSYYINGFTVLLSLLLAIALVTPAASAPAALAHGNVQWVNTREASFYGVCISAMSLLIAIIIGIPLGNLLFPL